MPKRPAPPKPAAKKAVPRALEVIHVRDASLTAAQAEELKTSLVTKQLGALEEVLRNADSMPPQAVKGLLPGLRERVTTIRLALGL